MQGSPRSGKTGIHLDNHVFARFRVEGVLNLSNLRHPSAFGLPTSSLSEPTVTHVALPDYTYMSDDLDRRRSQHVVFLVGQGLGRRYNDRVSGVCAKRVKVLHVTADDGVLLASHRIASHRIASVTDPAIPSSPISTHISTIPDYLIFNLLPSFQTFLNQYLWR
jgi:hypothetical protein